MSHKELKFDLNKLPDPHLKELNQLLTKSELKPTLISLTRIAKCNYNPEVARQQEWYTPEDERYIENPDFYRHWETAYLAQQAIYLCESSGERIPNEDLIVINEKLRKVHDWFLKEDSVPLEKRHMFWWRRQKNLQYPYQDKPNFTKLYRMLKILELGDSSYDYKKRFKEISGGLDYDIFIVCFIHLYSRLTTDFQNDAIDPTSYLKSPDMNFSKEDIECFFGLLACKSQCEFIQLYEEKMFAHIKNFSKGGENGEDIYHKLHQYILSPFRQKPLFQIEENKYICPSPFLLEFFFIECLTKVLRDKDGTLLTQWIGHAFHKYCLWVIGDINSKPYKVIPEQKYVGSKGAEEDGPADITLIVGKKAFLFECKALTVNLEALVSGRVTGNKQEWLKVFDRLNGAVVQSLHHIDILENHLQKTNVKEDFKNVTEFIPIIISYSEIFDINTTYEDSVHDCLNFLTEEQKEKLKGIDIRKRKFLVINPREYELLIELLDKDSNVFNECMSHLLDPSTFWGKDQNGNVIRTKEPYEIITGYCNKAKIDYLMHEQHTRLGDYFQNEFMENAKKK